MVGVAVVGAGLMGSLHAASVAALAPRARVVRVLDADPARAEALAGRVGAAAATEVDLALGDDVDAVVVAIPPDLHREVVERALAAGKHVFLEKPLATTAADADAIVAAAAASGRVLVVGLVVRFWPGYAELRRRVESGDLGAPVSAAAHRLQPPPDWAGWLRDPERSGGIAPLVAVHDLDQLCALLGPARAALARPLAGEGAAATHVVAWVEHEHGRAVVEASTSMPVSFPFTSGLRVVCERGAIEYALAGGDDEGAARFSPGEGSALRVFPAEGEPERVALGAADPWRAELEHFFDCVESGRAPEHGTPAQARAALAAALAVNRSLESGRAEPVGP